MEAVILTFDPVALAAHARDGTVGPDLEQDRTIGHEPPDGCEVEVEHQLEPEPAGDSLVGDRRIDVAVTDHGCTPRERRPDELFDVLRARGGIQRRLGPRGHVATVQQQVADLFTERRAAGLAREDDLGSLRLEASSEKARLGGLAGAVEALECDEHHR